MEAVVVELAESRGQYVLEEAAEELLGWEAQGGGLVGLGFAVPYSETGFAASMPEGDPTAGQAEVRCQLIAHERVEQSGSPL